MHIELINYKMILIKAAGVSMLTDFNRNYLKILIFFYLILIDNFF